jgi:DNA-binding transcriptional LysR family regulator
VYGHEITSSASFKTMITHTPYEHLDVHHIRVLQTVLLERSVSKAAIRLGMHQPGVSAILKKLRDMVGDPLLVRAGARLVPTEVGTHLLEGSAQLLRDIEKLFAPNRTFDPQKSVALFKVGASDSLDPLFLPHLVSAIKNQAPYCGIEIHSLSAASDYCTKLADGELDVVIGNWLHVPAELHQSKLFSDEVVCLVSKDNPATRRKWQLADWLEADHIAPTPNFAGALGIIDEHLKLQNLKRHIVTRCAHFGAIPQIVSQTLLVLTTGRQYCQRFTKHLPVVILPCPARLPALNFYQLWHDRSHASDAAKWLRVTIKNVVSDIKNPAL